MEEDFDIRMTVTDDALIAEVPVLGYDNLVRRSIVLTKEAFIECYEKWIMQEEAIELG